MVSWHVLYGLPRKYPVLRGMISYGLTWPCCSLVQEYLEFGVKFSEADWGRAARFGIFGAFFMAPVFYGWMRFTEPLFPQRNLKTCLKRAVVEQLSYTPFALAYFLLGISLMELKTFEEANEDVKDKFWRAYTVGFVFWPTAQTVNYCLIPERNRIIFVSVCSFIWTVFMAHVVCNKHQEDDNRKQKKGVRKETEEEESKNEIEEESEFKKKKAIEEEEESPDSVKVY